jgi:acyl-CoA synthetase (AMP-forming)/AMP-acid ligase II
MIISGGYNIWPMELENAIAALPRRVGEGEGRVRVASSSRMIRVRNTQAEGRP